MYDSTMANRNTTPKVKLATASLPADRMVIPVFAKSPETVRTNPAETKTPSIRTDVSQASLLESESGSGTSAKTSRTSPPANSREFNALAEKWKHRLCVALTRTLTIS